MAPPVVLVAQTDEEKDKMIDSLKSQVEESSYSMTLSCFWYGNVRRRFFAQNDMILLLMVMTTDYIISSDNEKSL